MALRGHSAILRVAFGLSGLALATFAAPSPADAQGFFERIFGGLRRAIHAPARPPSNANAFVDPFTSLANALNPPAQRAEGSPSRGFCVRGCDGRYFPVQASADMSAAESCHAFCPAGQARLYAGSNIDTALAADGSRYADSDNAYLYRKQMVAGCTCNGRDAFGLAHIDAASDPTLRPGDIVATKNGLMAVTGSRNKVADFTPIENYSRLSKTMRAKLSETKIAPTASPSDVTSSIPQTSDKGRSAQLAR